MTTDSGCSLRVHRPGSDQYERLRYGPKRGSDWNARELDRYPAAIVAARSVADVVAAVQLARRSGWQVKARSGGHSWTDSSVRSGALLIDLSDLNECDIDFAAGTATVGPGIKGQELDAVLEPEGWYFPTGGCLDVGLGGYLLQGGFGYNRQVIGPACMSVTALDVVTATGDLVHADEHENPDLYWAARGAAAGFFGIVTRFHLKLHRQPHVRLATSLLFPLAETPFVTRWLMDNHDSGRLVREAMVGMTVCPLLGDTLPPDSVGRRDAGIVLRASAAGESVESVRAALAPLDDPDLRARGVHVEEHRPVVISQRRGLASVLYPDGGLYVADNMWTNATGRQIADEIAACVADLPTRRSHVSLEAYHPHELPDMAFSMQGRYYLSVYGARDEADKTVTETELAGWTTKHMRRLEPWAHGIQFADENLIARPAAGLSAAHAQRLERLRDRYDPDRVFLTYLTSDEEGTPR